MLSLAASWVGATSLAACNGRLEVTDANVDGNAGAAGAAGSGQGGSDNAGGPGGHAGTTGDVPFCDDGTRNGDEEGVDCGGSACPECASGNACTNPVECQSGVCTEGVCQPASCDDGVRNGDEESVDCGGTSGCGPCQTLCHEQCAVSDTLIPVGCDPAAGAGTNINALPRLSDDGTIIAFSSCDEDSRCGAFYWTATEGTRELPITGGGRVLGASGDAQRVLVGPLGALGAQALLMSPDGTSVQTGIRPQPALLSADGTLVGTGSPTLSTVDLLRLRAGGSVETLGELPFTDFVLTGASTDASVVVGYSSIGSYQPFRYTTAGGLVVGLDGLPETADGASIDALSRDGQVFAGVTALGNTRRNVYRWTADDGIVELGAVMSSTPGFDSQLMGLSDDGSVLVYTSETNAASGDFSAFRWTAAGGAEALTPGTQSGAWLISGDGSVIVGKTVDNESFMWTEEGGARSLRATLEAAGVDLRGWTLGAAESISRDGRFVAGVGTCGGVPTAYRMLLPE